MNESLVCTEEAELWQRWRGQGDGVARDLLARQYLGYARVVAATYYSRRYHNEIEFADYYQLACVGLMEAIDRFDPGRNVQFKTFASRRMQGAILDGLERMTEMQQQVAARSRLRAQRLEGLREMAETPPVAAAADLPGGLQRAQVRVLNYVAEVGLGLALSWLLDGTGMVATEPRSQSMPFYQAAQLRQLRERLLELVAALPAQESAVVRGHYLQGRLFEEIAVQLGVTRGRVSQVHRKAIIRLRESLHTEQLFDVSY